jgi:hypothetical protein
LLVSFTGLCFVAVAINFLLPTSSAQRAWSKNTGHSSPATHD